MGKKKGGGNVNRESSKAGGGKGKKTKANFDDIDFESDEFSRKFYVQSSDRKFAYDVLHPRMMEFLLQTTPPMIDVEGGALCLSGGRRR